MENYIHIIYLSIKLFQGKTNTNYLELSSKYQYWNNAIVLSNNSIYMLETTRRNAKTV